MVIPISYSEIYGHKPTDRQLNDLISTFTREPTFISLCMWDLMFSLFEGDAEKYKYLQEFFIANLIRQSRQQQVLQLSALASDQPRPVFGRWQLLALMKKVLLETSNTGKKDPRNDDEARRSLGDACLMLNDLLFTEEQIARLEPREGAQERERIHDELMTQWFFQFELYYVPDVYQAVARNDEYFNIFEQRAAELKFADKRTLPQRFLGLTGLGIRQYLRLYFSIYVLHSILQDKHPAEINADPSIINFAKETIFSLLELDSTERNVFFEKVLVDLPRLLEGVKRDIGSHRAWQFDFTTFRNFPLVYNSEDKRGFTCIAFPFLIEKLASGVYHTILNSWIEGDTERANFQGYWGKVFEQYVNDRLREEYPILTNRLHTNPYFHKKRNSSIEVSDAIINYGDSLVLLEHKGGYLSIDEKYSDDAEKLLSGVSEKFGLNKAVNQLTRSIGLLFDENVNESDTFSERGEQRRRINIFPREELRRICKVYPVLVVQDFSMAIGFMNRRLRLQFAQKMQEYNLHLNIRVRPLSVLTIENLENALEHLGEITLTDILDEYSSEQHQPLSTFNGILDKYLIARGLDEKRRYNWSVQRCEEFLNSILERFKESVALGH
jgi:hypothetical protein